MSDMRTEEEQIEAIKGWWKANGKSLVVSVVISLAAVFGWKGWQQKQLNAAEAASVNYQNLLDAVITALNSKNADDYATSQHLAKELKENFDNTAYAHFAGLLMAKVAVQQENFDRALNELDEVISSRPSMTTKAIALLRKARVYHAMGQWQKGVDTATQVELASLSATKLELLGDLYVQLNNERQARDSYTQALVINKHNPLLKMKLEDLQGEG